MGFLSRVSLGVDHKKERDRPAILPTPFVSFISVGKRERSFSCHRFFLSFGRADLFFSFFKCSTIDKDSIKEKKVMPCGDSYFLTICRHKILILFQMNALGLQPDHMVTFIDEREGSAGKIERKWKPSEGISCR